MLVSRTNGKITQTWSRSTPPERCVSESDFSFVLNCPRRQRQRCDYCLTTISSKPGKAGFPSVFNGFRNVRRILTLSPEIRTMIENTAFYQNASENSDSVGRTFESCRAYQNPSKVFLRGIFFRQISSRSIGVGVFICSANVLRQTVWDHRRDCVLAAVFITRMCNGANIKLLTFSKAAIFFPILTICKSHCY